MGPGAGFAVLSSFLAIFLGFLYSLLAVVTWPFRQLRRLLRSRKALARAEVKRVVILGLDGMDPGLAVQYMKEGKLPNFARLRETGTFCPLETTTPPISPVAWSSFQTGVNPGKHNIFDFLCRDTRSYLPYLSSAQIRAPKRALRLGTYTIRLGRPCLKLLRKAKPFWHYLGEAGIFSSVIRVPITFPPERFFGVLLSGMCVPDLAGSQGTFSFYTTRKARPNLPPDKNRIPLTSSGDSYCSYIRGPRNDFHRDGHTESRIPFRVRLDRAGGSARIEIQGQHFTLHKGEYSSWIELKFRSALGTRVHGICRLYLKEISPDLEFYISPVNIHPGKPALPISHPFTYSIYLSKLLGPYATLGLAEDTWALNEGVLDDDAFLRQCYLIHEERKRMFVDALEKTPRGLVVCVFDITDRIQHMFWSRDAIEELYQRMDELVGRTLQQLDNDALLLVMSDHGFKSFRRGVNLNSWLWQNGLLALDPGANGSGEWFSGVDWHRTRAYALGLNGLYVNQQGREGAGIVQPGQETEELKQQLREKLRGLVDPQTGQTPIRELFDSRSTYNGPYRDGAPDLIVGYEEGYRAAWDSVKGKVTPEVFEDNCRAWSGDHCIDPRLVPGVLFSNRKLACERPSILDIAPTVLQLFGLSPPLHFDGKSWRQIAD